MMMVSSSPGRAEKLLAPPFTKLMRGSGGSRSRGRASASLARSTSSPMFVTRRRSSSTAADARDEEKGEEPSSPKVTCIGQVRITKKKKKSEEDQKKPEPKKQARKSKHSSSCSSGCCLCFDGGGGGGGVLSCNPFFSKAKKKKSKKRSNALKWKWCLWSSPCSRSYQKQRKEEEHAVAVVGPPLAAADWSREVKEREFWARRLQLQGEEVKEKVKEEEEQEEEKETEGFVLPTTPPKNALLLMRCRSAPQRSSPLTARFLVAGTEADDADTGVQPTTSHSSLRESKLSNPITCFNSSPATTESKVARSRRSSNSDGQEEEEEGSCDVSSREEEEEEEAKVGPSPSFSSRPLILTRCKSEPARKAANLAAAAAAAADPEVASHCFLNRKGSGKSKKWLSLAQEPFPK